MRRSIIDEIMMVNKLSNKRGAIILNDVLESKILDTDTTVGEALEPEEMIGTVSDLLYSYAIDKKENVEKVKDLAEEFILNDCEVEAAVENQNLNRADIGIALLKLGAEMLSFETIAKVILEDKLDKGIASMKDIQELKDYGYVYIDEELVDEIKALEDKSTKATKDISGDKKVLIELIKDRVISDHAINKLLLSKYITLKDLSDNLPGVRFDEVLRAVGLEFGFSNPKKVEKESIKGCGCKEFQSNIKNIDTPIKALKSLEKTFIEESLLEDVPEKEKKIRNRIKNNLISDEEIVEAIIKTDLNPFYIEAAGTLSKERINNIKDLIKERILS